MGNLFGKGDFLYYLYSVIKKNKVMRVFLLLKHIEKRIVISTDFKNDSEAINWWKNFPCSEEWMVIHVDERKKSGHRYELAYSKFDEQGKLYSKYMICFSKKEAVILEKKVKAANSNYITNIKKLY